MSETDWNASETSARLNLPLMQPGQAQKEWTHNEALVLIDLAVQACVEAVGRDDPPATPVDGQAWVVGAAPTGDWAGCAQALAGWTAGGWRFVAAREGLCVWDGGAGCGARFTDGAWRLGSVAARELRIEGTRVIGPQNGAIADPVDGATVDGPARTAIGAILTAMRTHGLIAT